MSNIHAFNEQSMRQYQAEVEIKFNGDIGAMRAKVSALQSEISSIEAAMASAISEAESDDPPRSIDTSSYRSAIRSCERNIQALNRAIAALEQAIAETREFVEGLVTTMQTLDMTSAAAMRQVQELYNQYTQNMKQVDDSFQSAVSNMSGDLRKIAGQMTSPAMLALNTSLAAAECYPQLANILCGDPVDLLNGAFLWNYTDISLEGAHPLQFQRFYASNMNERNCGLGKGWSHSFAYKAEAIADTARVFLPQNKPVFFQKGRDGKYTLNPKGSYELEKSKEGFVLRNGKGTVVTFDGDGNPLSIKELGGSEVKLTCENGQVVHGQSPCGSLSLCYENARLTAVCDHTGREIRYSYDENGNMLAMTNPDGDSLHYTYDENSLIASITDFNGVEFLKNTYDTQGRMATQYVAGQGISTFSYDSQGQKNRFDRNDGHFNEIEYDNQSRIIAQTDNAGTHRFTYDELNRRTADIDKLGRATIYRYAGDTGNVCAVLHPDGSMEQMAYNAANQIITRKTADGGTTIYEYDDKGNLARITDPRKAMYTFRHDESGYLIESADPMGAVTRYERDGKGNLLAQTDPLGNMTRYAYDAIGRITSITDPLGHTTSHAYSAAGKLLCSTDALGGETKRKYTGNGYESSVVDANGNATLTVYNEVNKPLTVTDAQGNIYSNRYDEAGNHIEAVSPEGRKTTYEYDMLGRMLSVTDPHGNKTGFTYDAMGNMTAKTNPLGHCIQTEYDAADRAVKMTDERGGRIEMLYDKAGRPLATKNALGGEIRRTYDAAGNCLSETDANGNTTSFAYDAAGRLTAMIDPLGGRTEVSYNQAGQMTSIHRADGASAHIRYDEAGRAVEGLDAMDAATRFEYDALGRMTRRTDALGGSKSYAYDGVGNVLSVTDERQSVQRFHYDRNNRLIRAEDAMGGVTKFAYTPDGQIASVRDALGGESCYAYDLAANLIRQSDPAGNTTHYAYDALGRVCSMTDANGGETHYAYDETGNMTALTHPDGALEQYEYDLLGRLIRHRDAQGHATVRQYDANGNLLAVTNPLGHVRRAEYDAKNRVICGINEEGGQVRFEYDTMDRVIRTVNEDGAVTAYEYDAAGRLMGLWDAMGSSKTYERNAMGHVTAETDEAGVRRTFQYDGAGNLLCATDGLGNEERYEYDALGRAVMRIDRGGSRFLREYDALGRIVKDIDALGHAQVFCYDGAGRIISVTDRGGNTTRYELDGMGNIVKQTDALGHATCFAYDARGRLLRLLQSQGKGAEPTVTTYAYDGRGLVVREVNALGDGKLFVYDGAGNLIQKTDEEGNVTQYEYTATSRIRHITYGDGKTAQFAYNKAGQLVGMQDWNGITQIDRDPLQRVKSVVDALGHEVRYDWDEVSNRTKITYPDGGTYRYGYDAERRNITMTGPDGLSTAFRFDAAGNMTEKQYPNGERTEYAYDPNRRLQEMLEFGVGGAVSATRYCWDARGNRTGETVHGGEPNGQSATARTFGYDALNRLVSVTEPRGASEYRYDALGNLLAEITPDQRKDYRYNPMNQLMRREETPINGGDSLSMAYEYDRRGNRVREVSAHTGVSHREFTYDAANRMIHGQTEKGVSSYRYDALGRRIMRETRAADAPDSVSRTRSAAANMQSAAIPHGDSLQYILDFTSQRNDDLAVYAQGFFAQDYAYANGQRIAQATKAWEGTAAGSSPAVGLLSSTSCAAALSPLPETLYIHEDIMGSTSRFSGSKGGVFARIEYDVWGLPVGDAGERQGLSDMPSSGMLTPRYTNHTFDDILGVYHAQYRFFDADSRGFTQEDPVRDTLNWYGYCGGNPTGFVDPLGLKKAINILDNLPIVTLPTEVKNNAKQSVSSVSPPPKPNYDALYHETRMQMNQEGFSWGLLGQQYEYMFKALGQDIEQAWNSFTYGFTERYQRATNAVGTGNKIYGYANAYLWGIPDGIIGIWNAEVERANKASREGGVYNHINSLTWGFADSVVGTVQPDRPWSLQHILDSFAVVGTIYGVGQGIKAAQGAGAMSASQRAMYAEMDYRLSHFAKIQCAEAAKGVKGSTGNWKTVATDTAENVNKTFPQGYEPPYKPGTQTRIIELTENTKAGEFIRVYDNVNSGQVGGWVMKAEDITGLTPWEIQNKFALPSTPMHVTDVLFESGTQLRTGTANGLFGFEGGGAQFDMMGQRVGEFINGRPLQ